MAIAATEVRRRLFPLIKHVNDDRAAVEVVAIHWRTNLAADDCESSEKTDYLSRSPANADRLVAAANEVRHLRPRPLPPLTWTSDHDLNTLEPWSLNRSMP
jgi:antitoxin YefM